MKARRIAGAVLLLGAGCNIFSGDPGNRVVRGGEGRSISITELEQRTKNFADRYVQLVAGAVENIKERATVPKVKHEAHMLKLRSATSAWDVVTSSHPLQEMLDLFVQVELQVLIWVDEKQGERLFGPEGGRRVVEAMRSAREEILGLASRALDDAQIRDIQNLIRAWRRRNPRLESGTFVRFGPYLDAPGGTLVTTVLSGFGLLDLKSWNPLEPTTSQVERVGDTADDAFFMAKRLPMILQWQAEAATYEILATASALGREAETTMEGGRDLLQDAAEAARAAQGAFEALSRITHPEKRPGEEEEKEEEGPPRRPFDVRDYESALAQLARTARETRELLDEAESAAGSSALTARVSQVAGRVERILSQLLVQALLLLIVFFVLLTAYKAASLHLRERHERARPR